MRTSIPRLLSSLLFNQLYIGSGLLATSIAPAPLHEYPWLTFIFADLRTVQVILRVSDPMILSRPTRI